MHVESQFFASLYVSHDEHPTRDGRTDGPTIIIVVIIVVHGGSGGGAGDEERLGRGA